MPVQIPEDCLISELDRLSGLAFRRLRLPPALEDSYEEATRAARCKRLWLEGLLGIVLFDVFLLLDHAVSASHFRLALLVRLGLVTPLALLVNGSMLLQPTKLWREGSIAFVSCLAGLAELAIESNRSATESAYAQFGMVAVVLFANTVMRLRFPFAIAASLVTAAGEVVFLADDRFLSHGGKLLGLSLTLSTMLVTLIANYGQNREDRLNFLLCLRADTLIAKLTRVNSALAEAAHVDSLTGIANRLALEQRLGVLWDAALKKGSVLSLILIDIDHFKRLNDTYGHLYGDRVLRRIARLLSEAVRNKEDFVARFGGEEFIVLLPGATKDSAVRVAERLRGLVELAGLPALEASGTLEGASATISCGVASASPLECEGVTELLEAADQALYQAKRQGRNLVRDAGVSALV